jgi:RNA polymerase sigma-70 factor, ECF subfamily
MEVTLSQGRLEPAPRSGRINESELLRSLQNQNADAFMVLYDCFHRQVFRFLVHMTGSSAEAEELLQVVFASVWEGMNRGMFQRFDSDRGTLEGYLLGIARHAARRVIRRRGRIVSVDEAEAAQSSLQLSEGGASMAAIESGLETQRLRIALTRLPLKFREAIVLCCLQDLSYEEAAVVMQCSTGTVGSRVNRGKALLRRLLTPAIKEKEL